MVGIGLSPFEDYLREHLRRLAQLARTPAQKLKDSAQSYWRIT